MAENGTTNQVKYLSYDGLLLFKKQLQKYYANNTKLGVVGASDVAYKLASSKKIEFIGGIQGDAYFDGSKDITISTVLNIPSTIDSDITGNALSATNFQNPKPINLTGDLEGYGVGGSDNNGWTVTASIKDGSVTSSKLFGKITNDKLLNSSITIGTTKASLGSTVTDIDGLNSITATTFVGNLEGVANSATTALADEKGNNIYSTYATKAELQSSQSALKFKGSVATYSELPSNADNGDIYNVEDEGKTYIWSSTDNKWSVFGSSYGPATSDSFGLVRVGENITNASGVLSINQSNVESALGYMPISGIKVNGTAIPSVNRVVDIQIPTEYATQTDIDNAFTKDRITSALGYSPLRYLSVNGVDVDNVNDRVNVDLSSYATQSWTSEQIDTKLSSLYSFKGSVQTYGDLLLVQFPNVGDTYNVITGNNPEVDESAWPSFSSGTNFAWDGDEWDSLGGSLDLSGYYKKTETDALLNTKAPVSHSHDDKYYSKAEVDALIEGVKAWVREYVASTMQQATDEGKINDIRVYDSYRLFPTTGIADVEYVDSSTGLEYHWVTDSEGGHYEQVNKTVTSEDISQMFASV